MSESQANAVIVATSKARPLWFESEPERGQWEAQGLLGHYYRIDVCDDGTFDVSYSDEMPRGIETFGSLTDAQMFLNRIEAERQA